MRRLPSLAALAALCLCLPAGASADDAGVPDPGAAAPCPASAETGPHCVYLALRSPSRRAAKRLASKLEKDGVAAEVREDHSLAASLSDEQLRRLLGAKLAWSTTGASASDRLICAARIERVAPPARYRAVAAARIDPACP